jgi:hypothetical protein
MPPQARMSSFAGTEVCTMTNTSGRAAAFASAALLAATGATVGATHAQAAPRLPACGLPGLHLSVGRVTGGAGSLFYPLRFTNTSGRSCTLRGYPGVSLLGRGHQQIGAPATRNPHAVTTVVVRPGRTAFATVRTDNPGVAPQCRPASAFIQVFPPGSFRSGLIPYHLRACGSFEVNPVTWWP